MRPLVPGTGRAKWVVGAPSPAYNGRVIPWTEVLSRRTPFAVSLVLHAGLLGLLALSAARAPAITPASLRVHLVDAPRPAPAPSPPEGVPAPPAPRVAPPRLVRPAPPPRPVPPRIEAPAPPAIDSRPAPAFQPPPAAPPRVEATPQAPPAPPTRPPVDPVREPVAPPAAPTPIPDEATAAVRQASPPVRPVPATAAPETPASPSPAEPPPVSRVEARAHVVPDPAPPRPAESGLKLGGALPAARPAPGPAPAAPARPPLRDQIASIGNALTAEDAKRTVNLDSREPRFLSYLARVKRRIENRWSYPQEAMAVGIGGELLLVFTLNKAGTLTQIALLQSSGFPVLDEEALRAVKQAAPYDPFPAELGEEPWNITASFRYNVPRHSRR